MPAGAHYSHQLDINGKSTCFVITFGSAQGSHALPWNQDAPRVDKAYELWLWNYLFPNCAIPMPQHCPLAPPGSVANPFPPNPDPPADPVTGDPPIPPAEGCPPATSVPPDDHATSSKFSQTGQVGGQGGGFGNGPIDQMGQPLVIGLTPLATYGSADEPLYTQSVEIDVYQRDDGGHQVNGLHEGTGPGILCIHPPELQDYMLHGSGVNADSRWPTELSASTLLLHNCTRADASTGDASKTYLAFGNPLANTVLPKSGIYADYDSSTGVLNWKHTNSGGLDADTPLAFQVDSIPVGNVSVVDTFAKVHFDTTSSEETIFEMTCPGGVMNATGALVINLGGHVLNNSGASRNITMRFYVNGVEVHESTTSFGASATERMFGDFRIQLKNDGAVDANDFNFSGPGLGTAGSPATGSGSLWTGSASGVPITQAWTDGVDADTADDVVIKATITMAVANAALTFDAFGGQMVYYPGR
jgi:hypothetical protein